MDYLVRRLLLFIPTLFLVSVIIFVLIRIVPGDPALAFLGEGTFTEEDYQALRRLMGLDKPIAQQYGEWIWNALHLDMGRSLRTDITVWEELRKSLPVTIELALFTLLVSLGLGIPIGILSAIKQDSVIDYLARSFSIGGLTLPTFWVGTMVVLVLSKFMGWLPPVGLTPFWEDPLENLGQVIFPALVLGFYLNASIARMTRTQMLEVLRQDYIRTAWAKGLLPRTVLLRHALKNAALPIITLTGYQVGWLLGFTVITETIFNLRGIGRLFVDSVTGRDYPMIQSLTLFFAFAFLTINLLVDLLYSWLDPRIRYR